MLSSVSVDPGLVVRPDPSHSLPAAVWNCDGTVRLDLDPRRRSFELKELGRPVSCRRPSSESRRPRTGSIIVALPGGQNRELAGRSARV